MTAARAAWAAAASAVAAPRAERQERQAWAALVQPAGPPMEVRPEAAEQAVWPARRAPQDSRVAVVMGARAEPREVAPRAEPQDSRVAVVMGERPERREAEPQDSRVAVVMGERPAPREVAPRAEPQDSRVAVVMGERPEPREVAARRARAARAERREVAARQARAGSAERGAVPRSRTVWTGSTTIPTARSIVRIRTAAPMAVSTAPLLVGMATSTCTRGATTARRRPPSRVPTVPRPRVTTRTHARPKIAPARAVQLPARPARRPTSSAPI